jgi:hypothetical protein
VSAKTKVREPAWLVSKVGENGWVKLTPFYEAQTVKSPLAASTLEYKKSFK